MKPLIYLASPYSHPDPAVVHYRFIQTGAVLAKAIEHGHLMFSPIVHSHPIADLISWDPINHAEGELSGWMKYDFDFIDKCDELWVLQLDGWKESRGVKAEVMFAFVRGKKLRKVSWPDAEVSEFYEPRELFRDSESVGVGG